jgi:hypothetical protein
MTYQRVFWFSNPATWLAATLIVLAFSTASIEAGNTNDPPRSIDVSVSAFSPLGDFYIEHHVIDPNEGRQPRQVWLVSARNPKKRELLYSYGRSVEVLVSENEKWLVINDHAGSNFSEITLFKRGHGIHYKNPVDISKKAWTYFSEQTRDKGDLELDHSYAEVLQWIDDQTLLISLHGHGDGKILNNWLCLYDVKTDTFSTDLNLHNRRQIETQDK